MNLVDQVVEQMIRKEEEENKRERSGLWNPSSFGRCYRYQIWNRRDVEKTNPPDMRALKIFRLGKLIHTDVQSHLNPTGVEYEATVEDVHMFVDYLTETDVWDFKSAGAWQFKKVTGKDYDVEKDNESYCLQLMSEVVLLDREVGHLVFIEKDTYATKEFIFKVEDWRERVEQELVTLRGLWENGGVPSAMPRAYGLKECNYCPFLDKCNGVENNTPKDREALAKEKRLNRVF